MKKWLTVCTCTNLDLPATRYNSEPNKENKGAVSEVPSLDKTYSDSDDIEEDDSDSDFEPVVASRRNAPRNGGTAKPKVCCDNNVSNAM